MKRIIFLRHAKSSWSDLSMSDKERPLNKRGQRDAPIMAKKLKELYPAIDIAMVSTSRRTKETLTHFAVEYKEKIKLVQFIDQLYHGLPEDYQDQLDILDDYIETILFIGHNPGVTFVANNVQNQDYIDNIPTCGIFVLTSDKEHWKDVELSACTRSSFIYPKMYV